jgi:hypothetical protein
MPPAPKAARPSSIVKKRGKIMDLKGPEITYPEKS